MRLTLLTAAPVVLALGLAGGCASGPNDRSAFVPDQSNPPYTSDPEYRQRMEGSADSQSGRIAPRADNRSQFTPQQSQQPYTAAPGYRERVEGASPSRAY